jgi:hypothetical protein
VGIHHGLKSERGRGGAEMGKNMTSRPPFLFVLETPAKVQNYSKTLSLSSLPLFLSLSPSLSHLLLA